MNEELLAKIIEQGGVAFGVVLAVALVYFVIVKIGKRSDTLIEKTTIALERNATSSNRLADVLDKNLLFLNSLPDKLYLGDMEKRIIKSGERNTKEILSVLPKEKK